MENETFLYKFINLIGRFIFNDIPLNYKFLIMNFTFNFVPIFPRSKINFINRHFRNFSSSLVFDWITRIFFRKLFTRLRIEKMFRRWMPARMSKYASSSSSPATAAVWILINLHQEVSLKKYENVLKGELLQGTHFFEDDFLFIIFH